MSINLYCNKKDLWQTPSQITDMCMTQADGTIAFELTGKKAKHALYIYRSWVQGSTDGVYHTKEDADYSQAMAKGEIMDIDHIINDDDLKFYSA